MQRFYFDKILVWELAHKKILEIKDRDFLHQISHVMRSRVWEKIIIFNSDSFEYIYEIVSISSKIISLNLVESLKNICDPEIEINLYQALPNKYEKIEYVIQKWTEVWISNFVFFSSERSQKLAINSTKIERFELIIKESLEQCSGNKKPNIFFYEKLPLTSVNWEKLILHTKWENSINLKEFEKTWEKINIFVWPEWGFSDKEIELFSNNHCKIINFGERILRTETAWIVASFYILNS